MRPKAAKSGRKRQNMADRGSTSFHGPGGRRMGAAGMNVPAVTATSSEATVARIGATPDDCTVQRGQDDVAHDDVARFVAGAVLVQIEECDLILIRGSHGRPPVR